MEDLPRIPGIGWNEALVPKKSGLGDIGLELELEGNLYQGRDLNTVKSERTGAIWVVHNDGSLRNGGLEYVLSTPCYIDEVLPMTEGLFSVLKKNKAEIQQSNRTSTHIHVNVTGMKVSELTSFIALWGVFEPAVIEWCGPLRQSNQFCLSSQDTGGWIPNEWVKALRNGRFHWDNTWKYSALNLAAFRTFGSFEFRCMAGADDPKDVYDLARFLWALREEAKKTLPDRVGYSVSEETPEGLLRRLKTDYSLGIVDRLLEQQDVNYRCIKNFREYQMMSFLYPWSDLKEEIDKKFIQNPFTKKAIGAREARPLRIEDIDWGEPVLQPIDEVIQRPARIRNPLGNPPAAAPAPRARFVEDGREYRILIRTGAGSREDIARIFGYRVEDVVVRDNFYYGVHNV